MINWQTECLYILSVYESMSKYWRYWKMMRTTGIWWWGHRHTRVTESARQLGTLGEKKFQIGQIDGLWQVDGQWRTFKAKSPEKSDIGQLFWRKIHQSPAMTEFSGKTRVSEFMAFAITFTTIRLKCNPLEWSVLAIYRLVTAGDL